MDTETRHIELDNIEDGREREVEASMLDRTISLPLTAGSVVAAAAILLAMALRLPELDRWAFNPTEGGLALAARDLIRGNTIPDDMYGKPFVVEWAALFMFLGDTTISIARLSMAVAGIAAIVALLGLRSRFGLAPVAATMALLALSPTLVTASRTLDGGALLVALSVLLLVSATRALHGQGFIAPGIAGVSLALLLLSGPLGLPAALLVALGVALLLRDEAERPDIDRLAIAGTAFASAFVLFSTALLTQPSSIYKAPAESLSLFWSDYLGEFGDGFQLAVWNLIVNEPLILLFAIVGIVWGRWRESTRALGIWALVALVVLSVLGDVPAGGHGLALIPLGLLAGIGAVELLGRLRVPGQRLAYPAAFVAALVVVFFAFVSLLGLASPEPGRTASQTIVRFLLIAIVALVPAGLLLARLSARLRGRQVALTVLTACLVLSAITLRSAVLSATVWPGEPGNLLTRPAMSDGIPTLIDRLYRISRDITRTERDARMPVGGVALRIALDQEIEQPFAWYFREFPNLIVFDPDTESLPEGTQLVILAGHRDADAVAPGMPGETYLFQYERPDYVTSPDWGGLLGDLFSVEGWRDFGWFLFHRETDQPVPATEFHLRAIPLIADRFAAATGPYNLNDRAGIGSAAGQFNQPRGIAFDAAGGVYVVDGGNGRIQHFDAAGEFIGFIGENELALFPGGQGGAGGLAVDDEGNLYVADTWNHQIKVYAPTGELINSWGSFYDAGDDPGAVDLQPGSFYGPRGIAIHDGLVYVTDTGNERVQVFELSGEWVRSFGGFGTEAGQLIEPVGIAVSPDGIVHVADSHNARIARFTAEGEPLDPWLIDAWEGQQFFEPYLVFGPDGLLYASDSVDGQIIVIYPEADHIISRTTSSLLRPYGMAISPDGREMLITDGIANAVIPLDLSTATQ